MKLPEVGRSELNEVLLEESRGIVVDFWGTWCQPCRSLRPHLEQLADAHEEQWAFVAVHVEEQPDLVERYDVTATPTLLFLRGGDEIHRIAGAATPSTIEAALIRHAA